MISLRALVDLVTRRAWTPRDLGRAGEKAAARFYRWRGYTIAARNVRWRDGEIDLVARRGRKIVFVEVKTRQQTGSGHPYEAVDREKQLQIVHLAQRFLFTGKLTDLKVHFDVMSILWDGRRFRIQRFEDAFAPMGSAGRPWKWE